MKITKYNHSCLLIEENGKVVVIDPGSYSETIFPTDLSQLDYMLVTHDHMDHFSMPLVSQLVKKFPDVKIISTASVVEQLEKEGITATTEGDEIVKVEMVPHEKMWGMPKMSDNIMVTVFGRLAHPGDSHTFTTDAEILALPVAAPWGSTAKAVEIAEEMHPKVVIPIHDFMIKDDSRRMSYQWIAGYLKSKGIDFKAIESGEAVEV